MPLIAPGDRGSPILSLCRWLDPGGSLGTRSPSARGTGPPRSSVAPVGHLTFERGVLNRDNFSRVIWTIQAFRRPSIDRIYNTTWSAFCHWCFRTDIDPYSVSISQVLEFLQDSLDKGLIPNTVHRQVAALSSVLSYRTLGSLS